MALALCTEGPVEKRLSFAAALESGAPTAEPLPGKAISGVETNGGLSLPITAPGVLACELVAYPPLLVTCPKQPSAITRIESESLPNI